MGHILTIIRSSLFNVAFIGWTFFIALVGLPTLFLSFPKRFIIPRIWAHGSTILLRTLCGIKQEALGRENIPTTPCIFACKHQSAWETFIFYTFTDFPCYILKQELLHIPLVRLYMLRCQMIPIARRNDPSVLKSLLKRAKNRIEEFKMSVVIFPEGTRTAYQEDRKGYQSGIAALYGSLNVPVVPVALNSGKHWSRNAFIKFPGTISIEFLPAIQPGLNRQEFMEKLEQQIESATAKLG